MDYPQIPGQVCFTLSHCFFMEHKGMGKCIYSFLILPSDKGQPAAIGQPVLLQFPTTLFNEIGCLVAIPTPEYCLQ